MAPCAERACTRYAPPVSEKAQRGRQAEILGAPAEAEFFNTMGQQLPFTAKERRLESRRMILGQQSNCYLLAGDGPGGELASLGPR
jgi:hypothetical protein